MYNKPNYTLYKILEDDNFEYLGRFFSFTVILQESIYGNDDYVHVSEIGECSAFYF